MKIIYLATCKIPSRKAYSIHVMKMCQAFVKNGHKVILLVPNHRDVEPEVNNPFEFYGVDACFKIKKLLPGFKGLIRYSSIVALQVRLHRPDLVYARCASLKYSLSTIGCPVILDSHLWVDKKKAQLFELIESPYFKRLVVTCDALRQAYQQEYSIANSFITVASNGADEPKSVEKLDLSSPAKLQVGYVGHLYPGKGMEKISQLARSCSWADFHVIGGTDSDLDYWKSRLKSLNNIFFYGFIPPSKTDQYRHSVDVLLVPADHYWRRGKGGNLVSGAEWMSPLKIFEYMAAGKAILASDTPFLRQVLHHKVTAWLCGPENPQSWIEGLTKLRDHPELRNSLGLRAREEFRAKYTWQARAATVLEGL